jgi:hypothetical protein
MRQGNKEGREGKGRTRLVAKPKNSREMAAPQAVERYIGRMPVCNTIDSW